MRQQRVIWAALVVSTFIYAIVTWVVTGNKTPSGTLEQELHQPVILILIVLALATFVASLSLRVPIVRWAITESCSIYGLMAAFLTHDWRLFAAGWVLSLAGFALSFPAQQEA
jgi:hypothetical protein